MFEASFIKICGIGFLNDANQEEERSTPAAHYSGLFALTSSALQKPEDQNESNDNVELKNTGGQPELGEGKMY